MYRIVFLVIVFQIFNFFSEIEVKDKKIIKAKYEEKSEIENEIYLLKDNAFSLLKKNSELTLNGEPFFPIGCYRDPDDELLNISNIVDVGFNLTHNYEFEHGSANISEAKKYLDLCAQNDLKVFMGINRQKIKNRDFRWIENWINELKDFPSLFTWYLYDEPKLHGITPELLIKVNSVIKSVDTLIPTSTVLCNLKSSKKYYDSYDILMIDEYPIPNSNIEMVYKKLKDATRIINGTKPVIAVLQAHDKYGKVKMKRGEEIINPTYNEIRCMTYLALASGVDGVIYYWSPNHKYHLKNQAPKVWNGLIKVIEELNKIKPYLLSNKKTYYKFYKYYNIAIWSSSFKNRTLLAVINTSKKTVDIKINLQKIEFNQLINSDSTTIFNKEDNKIECKFKPYEVKIYYLL